MTDSVPNYIQKLALTDDVISKGMVKLLHDFNIDIEEDKALQLFYSIITHLIYHLDTHPGNYFKLQFIDIVSEKDNLMCVKRNSDYTEDTVTPDMLYNRFSGSAVLRKELESTLDLFAKSFLGIKESKQRERAQVDALLNRRAKLTQDIENCNNIMSQSKTKKKSLIKKRIEEGKKLKAYAKKKGKACFISDIELVHREKFLKAYAELEAKLIELWEENISLKEMLDKTQ